MKMGKKLNLIGGIILTTFNIFVWIFTEDNIYPEYFEWMFAIYYFIGVVVGIWLIASWFVKEQKTEGEGK